MTRNVTRIWLTLVLGIALALTAGSLAWAGEAKGATTSDTTPKTTATLKAATSAGDADVAPAIRYRTRTINQEWSGWVQDGKTTGSEKNALPLISLAVEGAGKFSGSVQYQVHIARVGWLAVKSDGAITEPTAGINSPIDGVRVTLTGAVSKTHSVRYRAYLPGSGWQAWKSDGATAGATSKGTGIKALQVKLVEKEAASAGKGIVNVRYRTNSQWEGWSAWQNNNGTAGIVGKKIPAVGFQIGIDAGTYSGGVSWQVHDESGNWSPWRSGGTINPDRRIDAVQMKLTGAIANDYDIVYRAYLEGVGWQRRMRGGETAGAVGKGLYLDALRVSLVPKSERSGWIKGENGWSFYEKGKAKKSSWITTGEHPIATTLAGKQRYWVNSKGVLPVGCYVKPAKGFVAYATASGYVARGKFKNSDGLLLANKDTGKLYTTTRWLETSAFDGKTQRYRLVKKGSAAVVQTGFFKVSGKLYYAWGGKKGYLMRSSLKYMNNKWYAADGKGVLTVGGGANGQAIERYTRWAVKIAKDDSHGYSQANRWGPDYDCSSLVCASIKAAGFPESGASWTGNMRACLTSIGFRWHSGTSGLRRGDIVLVHNDWHQHTEIYLGNGQLVGAHSSENGGIYGQAGDQTGREISIGAYYNMPWDGYLRYKG